MKFFVISFFILLISLGAAPKFRDFNQANFFCSVRDVIKNEKRIVGSKLIKKDFDKDNTGVLIYKHEDSNKMIYYSIVEYHFIKNIFCKGVEKTFFVEPLCNLDSAIVKYKKNRELYANAYGQLSTTNDDIYEKSTLLISNNLRYENMITLFLIKSDSLYIPIETVIPLISSTQDSFIKKVR